MRKDTLNKITSTLKERYPEVGIHSIEVDEKAGKSTFYVKPTEKSLAFLDKAGQGGVTPKGFREKAETINRDFLRRQNLDLFRNVGNPYTEDPKESIRRAIRYYYTDPLIGSATNVLSNMAFKGFENDIDDPNIKNFYDTWAFDVNLEQLLEWIFLDFFKVGNVTTYKVIAKYEPKVSFLAPYNGKKKTNNNNKKASKETGAAKKIWSKGHLPVSYTVLNPELVNITGNLLFDKVAVTITVPTELRDLITKPTNEQSEEEKELIKILPPEIKRAAEAGGEFQLDSRLIGRITYRKQPYERYAKPRTTRTFESIEYKRTLREADISTLDGITNYILKITIGNDDYPVTSQSELEAVAQLFNTTSKSFDVVWNHTLEVEKIVSPEIASILGKGKYEQVNDELTTGLSITRALIDGGGEISAPEADLLVKGIMEEIRYARREVTRWLYREYQQIAEAMGFEQFPRVRWDEGVLQDTILFMNTLAQLVDRRMLSYQTALESLGFDYPNELENMTTEKDLVMDGTFGIIGSPWQQAKTQPVQGAPKGTPSGGRPKGQTNKKQDNTNPSKQQNTKPKNPPKSASFKVSEMSAVEYASMLDGAREVLDDDQYAEFVDEMGKRRFGRG